MKKTDLIERFRREYQEYHNITPKRAHEQRTVLENLRLHIGHDLDGLTAAEFTSFAAWLLAEGGVDGGPLHVNTVRKKMNMVRAWVSWAFAVGVVDQTTYMQVKAVRNPRGSTGTTQPNPYTRDEIAEFWRIFEERWPRNPTSGRRSRAVSRFMKGQGGWAPVWKHAFRLQLLAQVRLALDLGLRAHEIHQLGVNDLHYDNEYIVVWGKSDPNTGQKKVRQVPYTKAARAAIQEWVEFRTMIGPPHDRAWITCYSKWRLNPMDMARFEVLLQTVIGPEYRWHRLRHTCATEWLRAGMELETVSRLLGHANLQQTLCYAAITRHDLQRAVDRLEGGFDGAVGQNAGQEVHAAAA